MKNLLCLLVVLLMLDIGWLRRNRFTKPPGTVFPFRKINLDEQIQGCRAAYLTTTNPAVLVFKDGLYWIGVYNTNVPPTHPAPEEGL